MFQKIWVLPVALMMSLTLLSTAPSRSVEIDVKAVIEHYSDLALAIYEDSLTTAKSLDKAIADFIAAPSLETLSTARQKWRLARIPYQQSEAFRFANPIVDEWEGKVNSWPLDEGLIDYVSTDYGTESDENGHYTANIIANKTININGASVDASILSAKFLETTLHMAGGAETNVATGYHAIEFLLWGQDLNGSEPGAGNRAYTDFSTSNCTNGNCDRRAEYLASASKLLVSDLKFITEAWGKNGKARQHLVAGDALTGISTILSGLGSLSYGELAGERLKLGLLLHDPEEEHDCFSDNTHNSHYYDSLGIKNVYTGIYTRIDGSTVKGPSLSSFAASKDADLDTEMLEKLDITLSRMQTMVERADTIEAYDQMIGEDNDEGNAVVQAAIDGLIDQTRTLEKIIAALDLKRVSIEGSDSLDNPNAVFK